MKILYVSQYYAPEMGAPAARVSELAAHWVADGHEVVVLTAFPNHPTGKIHPDYRKKFRRVFYSERRDGVSVVRCWLLPLPNRRSVERVLNYMSFCISSALRGLFVRRPGIVIGTSPQLLVGLSAWWIARLRRVPFVFEVRDLWPEGILAAGVGRDDSLFARTLTSVSSFLYKRADHIVVVSPAFETDLVSQGIDQSKISVVPNGVETEMFTPGESLEWRRDHDLEKSFVVSFVGTIGLAHGLATVLEAALRLRERAPDVTFVVVGEGTERVLLEQRARAEGLDNVCFVGQVPRSEVPEVLRASDCALVLLKDAAAYEKVIPSKMLEFMAAGLPIVLGVRGQARAILDEAGAGIAISPESVEELVEAILSLRGDAGRRDELGKSGRAFVTKRFSRLRTASDYLRLLEALTS